MSWEIAMVMAFLGTSFIIAYIGNSIKSDEQSVAWTRFLPMGLRTILYFISFGFLLFGMGSLTPILVQDGIPVNETAWAANDTAYYLQQNIIGGVSLATKVFYIMIVILIVLGFILLIERMLLKQKKEKEERENWENSKW